MKDHDPRACAGTALVTLLAIAGFGCIVAAPAAEHRTDLQHVEARASAECDATLPHLGDLQ
jgi:hypothetical protein